MHRQGGGEVDPSAEDLIGEVHAEDELNHRHLQDQHVDGKHFYEFEYLLPTVVGWLHE